MGGAATQGGTGVYEELPVIITSGGIGVCEELPVIITIVFFVLVVISKTPKQKQLLF